MMSEPGQSARYKAASELVAEIDQNLTRDNNVGSAIPTYRDRAGVLLWTLDQVVAAILSDDLMPFSEAIHG